MRGAWLVLGHFHRAGMWQVLDSRGKESRPAQAACRTRTATVSVGVRCSEQRQRPPGNTARITTGARVTGSLFTDVGETGRDGLEEVRGKRLIWVSSTGQFFVFSDKIAPAFAPRSLAALGHLEPAWLVWMGDSGVLKPHECFFGSAAAGAAAGAAAAAAATSVTGG